MTSSRLRSRAPVLPCLLGVALSLSAAPGCGGKSRGEADGEGSRAAGGGGADAAEGSVEGADARGANEAKGAESVETVASAPVELAAPAASRTSPFIVAPTPAETAARLRLRAVVEGEALASENAWAIGHALIVLGPEARLPDGRLGVDVIFSKWAETAKVEGRALPRFPGMKGKIPVEPHPGLILKSIAEAGVDPAYEVTLADGTKVPVSALWRAAAHGTWAAKGRVSPDKWNDTPWLLQGLASWAAPGTAWTAAGGESTDLHALTHAVTEQLREDTAFLRRAMAAGETVQKRKQGIFAYTCGGQHLIQGVAYAIARGNGSPEDRAAMVEELDALLFRVDLELKMVDQFLEQAPEYRDKLLVQRLKFLGHTLETGHKMAAAGLVELDAPRRARLTRVRDELVRTIEQVAAAGLFDELEAIADRDFQLYLDLVGDSAHALRGFMLADGSASLVI